MKYGLIGEVLSHSYSPEIHALLAPYEYECQEIARDDFAKFMEARDFVGINVTMPYKTAVLPYLDEVDESVNLTGAANTIVCRDGRLIGYNTDLCGMTSLIRRYGFELRDKKVLICGSGGTSLTARAAAASLGAAEVMRISRSDRANLTYEEAYTAHADASVIINTTPAGMFPNTDTCAIDLSRFTKLSAVIDAVYNPLRTRLVCDALALRIPASGGLFMLAAQAVASSALFTSSKFNENTVRRVFGKMRRSKENIVLIGMPGCGKSTVGRVVAEKLSRTLYDTDNVIRKNVGRSPKKIIVSDGEAEFRKIERETVGTLRDVRGAVIACGGGTVLDPANVAALRSFGRLYYIDRPPEQLFFSSERPLSKNADDLMRLYAERVDIYRAAADVVINAGGSMAETVNAITEDFLR